MGGFGEGRVGAAAEVERERVQDEDEVDLFSRVTGCESVPFLLLLLLRRVREASQRAP